MPKKKKRKKTRSRKKIKRRKPRKKSKKIKAEVKEQVFKVTKKWARRAYVDRAEYEKKYKLSN
jgi:hypothetical protein